MRKRSGKRNNRYIQLTALALCAVLAGGGCSAPAGGDGAKGQSQPGSSQQTVSGTNDGQGVKKEPAYVYYIKDANLMRADVNGNMEPGKNPVVLAEKASIWANLKTYDDVKQAEDGSFSVFNFETGDSWFDYNEKFISVREEDGKTEDIMEGDAVAEMCGSTLWIQEPDTEDIFSEDLKINLYSYRPGEGKKLAVPDIYGFYPAEEGDNFCFSRLNESGDGQALYRYQDGQEILLAEGMDFAGLNKDAGIVYVERAVDKGEDYWHELARIGADGSMEEILTEEDHAANYYLAPEYGSLYYLVPGDTQDTDTYNRSSLYFCSDGAKTLLTDKFSMAYEFVGDPIFTDQAPVLFYLCSEGSQSQGLFAAVGDQVTEIRLPGIQDDWLHEYSWIMTEGDGALYMTVAKLDDAFQSAESWIYKFSLTDNTLTSTPECVAEGYAIDIQKVTEDGIFYSEHKDTWTLYCDGKKILDNYCPGTFFESGEQGGEYFAFCGSGQEAPDLMRLTSAGSSKVFDEHVVQCEPYAGGMVLLSGCSGSYPYLGTLKFCGENGFKVIDEGITGFFQHDGEKFMDAVPREWDWSGQQAQEEEELELDPNHDPWGRADIEDSTFHQRTYGFEIDLAPEMEKDSSFTIYGYGEEGGIDLRCGEESGGERYTLSMTDSPYKADENAAAYGRRKREELVAGLKNMGLDFDGEVMTVDKAEDITLDGRRAFKLTVRQNTLYETTYIEYIVPDEENGRMIELSGGFMPDNEYSGSQDMEAFQSFVESMKWV